MSYLGHFIVYLFAMMSVIGLALFVYKKFSITNYAHNRSRLLNVEEVLNLNHRKSLYIINAGGERFLIAGDMERTTLISKLGENNNLKERKETADLSEFIEKEDELLKNESPAVMKNLVRKLERGIR